LDAASGVEEGVGAESASTRGENVSGEREASDRVTSEAASAGLALDESLEQAKRAKALGTKQTAVKSPMARPEEREG
jgi:hypothetical protein